MTNLAAILTRWTLPLLAALVAVTLTALPSATLVDSMAPFTGALLIAAAAAWYWSLAARVEPEVLPKLRVGGLAVLVVLLGLLYGLLIAALGLPEGLATLLYTLLLGVTTAAIVVALSVAIDVSLLTRLRWARYVGIGVVVLAAARLLSVALAGDQLEPATVTGTIDLANAVYPLGAMIGLLALVAPTEWIVELDRRQRLVVLAGWVIAIVPLGVGVSVGRWLVLEHQHVLQATVELGSTLCLVYVAVTLVRAGFALPGTRAYERKARELDAIYDFGLTAGTAFNPQELQNAVLDSMLRVAEPDVALVVEPEPDGPGCACLLARADNDGEHVYRFNSRSRWEGLEQRFADRRPVLIVDHRKAPPGVLERIWEPSGGSSVIVPVITQDGVPRALLIVGRFESHAFNSAEVRSLAGFANQVALAMDHARLLRDTVESERRKRELEIARDLQLNLLPAVPPSIAGLDIADRSEPATEVGGDYFDYLTLENGNLAVVVGDVAGHGMPAGLLMAMAKSAIHTLVRTGTPAEALMVGLSQTMLEMSASNQFMTLVFTEIDLEAGEFRYSNAGHHYPFHYRAADGTIVDLESTGLPMGMLPRPPGPFRTAKLGPGDILVFYSDGIVEATRADEEMFGLPRLRELILAHRHREANTIIEATFRAVRAFCGDMPLHDDATMVIVRVLEPDDPVEGEEDG